MIFDEMKEKLCWANHYENTEGGRSWCLVRTDSSDINVWQSKVPITRKLTLLLNGFVLTKVAFHNRSI